MKKDTHRSVLVRLPAQMIKRLDTAAKREQRSRTAEIRVRLDASFRPAPVGVAQVDPS